MNILLMILLAMVCVVAAYAIYVWVLTLAWPDPAPHSEVHRVTTKDDWTITLFRHLAKEGSGEPVLLCHGAFANRLNLTMPEGRSIADTLCEAGYDCWAIEYRGSASGEPPAGVSKAGAEMDDYLLQDLPAAVDYIREYTGYPKLHWVGHSMGGMLFFAFDELYGGDALASATTLGSPIGFVGTRIRREPLLLAIHQRFPTLFLWAVRGMIPVLRALRLPLPFLPVNVGNIDPALPTRHLFWMVGYMGNRVIRTLHDAAVQRNWRMDGGKLDVTAGLPDIETPLFAILGVKDPFVPVSEGERFHENRRNPDKRLLVLSKANGHSADYNHVDLSMSPHCREEVHEPIVEWLRAHPIAQVTPVDTVDPIAEPVKAADAATTLDEVEETSPCNAPGKGHEESSTLLGSEAASSSKQGTGDKDDLPGTSLPSAAQQSKGE